MGVVQCFIFPQIFAFEALWLFVFENFIGKSKNIELKKISFCDSTVRYGVYMRHEIPYEMPTDRYQGCVMVAYVRLILRLVSNGYRLGRK